MLIARLLQRLSISTCFIFQDSQSLHTALEELNNTVVVYQKLNDIKLLNVDSAIGNLSQRVMLLENSALAVNNLDKRENLSISVVSIWWLGVSTQAGSFNTSYMLQIQLVKLKKMSAWNSRHSGFNFKRLEFFRCFWTDNCCRDTLMLFLPCRIYRKVSKMWRPLRLGQLLNGAGFSNLFNCVSGKHSGT